MGAVTVALGLPSLVLQPQFISRGSFRVPRLSLNFSINRNASQFGHSHSKSFEVKETRKNLRHLPRRLACSASASWPYESWATEDGSQRGNSNPFQETGFEVLAMGLGVVVTVALAFSKQGAAAAAAGLLVGIPSLAFAATATATVTLRHQIVSLLRMLVAHFNAVQAAMALQLASIRNNVIIWGTSNGAGVSSSTVESATFPAGQENKQVGNVREDSNVLSSAEIEAALSDIAKSVAQLTMVVVNLDNKVSTLEKTVSNNVSSFNSVSQNNKTVKDISTSTDVGERQNGTYRIRNSVINGRGTQLKWEEVVVKDERTSQVKPQGYQPVEDSLASNRVDEFSISEYGSKAVPSTIIYDSRGDRVLLLNSTSPVDFTIEIESSSSTNLGQSSPSKFSKVETGDSTMELFFQDVGQEDVVIENQDHAQSKQNVAHVEATIARNPMMESVAQPQHLNTMRASPVHDNTVFNNKAVAPRRERIYNQAQREEETSGRGVTVKLRSEYELDGSESYRAVPTTVGIASKPDVLSLKRIMSGAEPSAMTQPKAAEALEVAGSQSISGWDASGSTGSSKPDGVNDRLSVGRGATRPEGVQAVLSYDGQEQSPRGRPRPEGSQGIESSSKADYGQRWPRDGSSDATDTDFGGNGSSSDTNEGGNGSKRRQGSSPRSSAMESDSDEDRDRDAELPPTSQGDRKRSPSSRASPSYPSARTESFRNLPEPSADDEAFQKILVEVDALLKEGREGLEGRIEVGVAERMLYEAAELCEKAVEMRPSSLVAVGVWGNTLLLHGELKLRLSQNLRGMLPEPPSKSLSKRELKEIEEERADLEATLQDVGEECEQLLLEAGRKYRLALSMDRTDMRALYNWGLALCYRGQLIAEEGGETAAQDADKVFLAAIDKFEAMIGLSDTYAAGALLNWGLAMRDRSRLRPLGSKERQRILAQAKEIFLEALRLDPNYGQARGAVAACTVELKGLQEYEPGDPKKLNKDPSSSRGFRDWWG